MRVTIDGSPKEIAALVLAVQRQQTFKEGYTIETKIVSPLKVIKESVQTAIGDIAERAQDSSSPSSCT